jgi:hypothetical protein
LEGDRQAMVTKPLAGRLFATLWHEQEVADQVLAAPVSPADARALGKSDDELFGAAAKNISAVKMRVDIMRVTDECRLFFHLEKGDGDPNVGGRILDMPGLRAEILRVAPPPVKALLDRADELGAIVSLPSTSLLPVFFVDASHLQTGMVNMVANTQGNREPGAEDAVSPWLYWVSGGRVEEVRYQCDDEGNLQDLSLPHALVPLWNAG